MEQEFECSICGVVYPSENEAKGCCASRKDRKELEEQTELERFVYDKMECDTCKKEMDEESQEFCEEYEIQTCLDCCGKDYEKNAEAGIWYHLSIPVYAPIEVQKR